MSDRVDFPHLSKLDNDLVFAAKDGNVKKVKRLLAQKANPCAKLRAGYTMLIVAASEKDAKYAKVVKLLLENNATSIINARSDTQQNTALTSACGHSGNVETVKALLEHKADTSIMSMHGNALTLVTNKMRTNQMLSQVRNHMQRMQSMQIAASLRKIQDLLEEREAQKMTRPKHPEKRFEALCGANGYPIFMHREPTWYYNAKLKTTLMYRLAATSGVSKNLLEMSLAPAYQQKQADDRYAYFQQLVRKQDAKNPGVKMTIPQWEAAVAEKSGWDMTRMKAECNCKELLSEKEFQNMFVRFMHPSKKQVKPPQNLEKLCDLCRKPCLSRCICGEAYCSIECQVKDWIDHKKFCYAVFDGSYYGMLMNMMEYKEVAFHRYEQDEHSWQNHCAAQNCTVKRGEKNLKRCGKCLHVYYCSRECQVNDWKIHKSVCRKQDDLVAQDSVRIRQ